jgi:hypothetical protein
VIPSASKPAVGAAGLGAGLLSDPDEIVASRSRSRVEGDWRKGKSRNLTRAMPVSEATG